MHISAMTNAIFQSRLRAGLLLFALTVAVYSNTLFNGFVWDDHPQILSNPWIEDVRHIPAILSSPVWGFEDEVTASNYYRPTMHLLYMAEYHLFGRSPWGWHLVNVLLHGLSAVVALIFFSRMLKKEPGAVLFAFMGASLFALHTINSEVAGFVAAVPELLLAIFYISALILYAKSVEERSKTMLALSTLAFFMAILSKEPAITFGPMLAAFDLYEGRRPWKIEVLKRYAWFAVALAVYMAIRTFAMGAPGLRSAKHGYLDAWQAFVNIFPLAAKYLKSMLLPTNLSPFHVFDPAYSITDPRALVSITVVVLVAAMVVMLALKISRLFVLSLAMFFITLSLALYVPVLGLNAFSEVYVYLPSTGFALFMAVVFSRTNKKAAAAGYLVMISLLGLNTFMRNFDWKDDLTIWKKTVENQPDNYYALFVLGGSYKAMGDNARAVETLTASIEANERMARPELFTVGNARVMLAEIYMNENRYPEAIAEYLGAIEASPQGRHIRNIDYNLGLAYQKNNELQKAAAAYAGALNYAATPQDAIDIYLNLGNVLAMQGEFARATFCYNEVLKADPQNRSALANIAAVAKMARDTR
jgi:tetratricopeptide (TPR) repeat protein